MQHYIRLRSPVCFHADAMKEMIVCRRVQLSTARIHCYFENHVIQTFPQRVLPYGAPQRNDYMLPIEIRL